jgi:serine/threonine-protein kinase RsbW
LERQLIIPSKLVYINDVKLFLDEIFTESNLDRDNFNRVFLGLSEAVCNSIVHGNRLDASKNVILRGYFSEGKLVLEVEDEGEGFLIEQIEDPTCLNNLKKENGRGIFLLRKIADEVVFCEGGQKVLIGFIFN